MLLYLCAKFNLHTFAQNILVHRSINPDKQMTSSKDGLPPDHQTYKYENDGWSSGSDATAQEVGKRYCFYSLTLSCCFVFADSFALWAFSCGLSAM